MTLYMSSHKRMREVKGCMCLVPEKTFLWQSLKGIILDFFVILDAFYGRFGLIKHHLEIFMNICTTWIEIPIKLNHNDTLKHKIKKKCYFYLTFYDILSN